MAAAGFVSQMPPSPWVPAGGAATAARSASRGAAAALRSATAGGSSFPSTSKRSVRGVRRVKSAGPAFGFAADGHGDEVRRRRRAAWEGESWQPPTAVLCSRDLERWQYGGSASSSCSGAAAAGAAASAGRAQALGAVADRNAPLLCRLCGGVSLLLQEPLRLLQSSLHNEREGYLVAAAGLQPLADFLRELLVSLQELQDLLCDGTLACDRAAVAGRTVLASLLKRREELAHWAQQAGAALRSVAAAGAAAGPLHGMGARLRTLRDSLAETVDGVRAQWSFDAAAEADLRDAHEAALHRSWQEEVDELRTELSEAQGRIHEASEQGASERLRWCRTLEEELQSRRLDQEGAAGQSFQEWRTVLDEVSRGRTEVAQLLTCAEQTRRFSESWMAETAQQGQTAGRELSTERARTEELASALARSQDTICSRDRLIDGLQQALTEAVAEGARRPPVAVPLPSQPSLGTSTAARPQQDMPLPLPTPPWFGERQQRAGGLRPPAAPRGLRHDGDGVTTIGHTTPSAAIGEACAGARDESGSVCRISTESVGFGGPHVAMGATASDAAYAEPELVEQVAPHHGEQAAPSAAIDLPLPQRLLPRGVPSPFSSFGGSLRSVGAVVDSSNATMSTAATATTMPQRAALTKPPAGKTLPGAAAVVLGGGRRAWEQPLEDPCPRQQDVRPASPPGRGPPAALQEPHASICASPPRPHGACGGGTLEGGSRRHTTQVPRPGAVETLRITASFD